MLALGYLLPGTSACSSETKADHALVAKVDPKHHVIVIGTDGLGSHNLWRESERGIPAPKIPHIEGLIAKGAWSKKAQIDERYFSGPNWMGMLTSAPSSQHGVITNNCERGNGLETIFGALRKARPALGITVVYEWGSIACYPEEGSVTRYVKSDSTTETGNAVIQALRDDVGEFIFIDFDAVDEAGHRAGGSSREYVNAVEGIDHIVGEITAAVAELGLTEHTHFVLTADHGHMGDGSGHSDPQHPVFFVVQGPGVQPGEITEEVRNSHVAQVVAYLFGVAPSADWAVSLAPFDRYLTPFGMER
jgi:hypothetical protein